MKNPIFLVSTGRTGTKFFSSFFSTYGIGVAAYHTSDFTRLINVLGNMYRHKLISRKMMKTCWRQLKYRSIKGHKLRYIECNPYYYNILDIIRDFFPETQIIFVVRSPKTFILSHLKWERQRWQSIIANRLVPFWQPVPYCEQLKGFNNDYYQRVKFYSMVWTIKNNTIWKFVSRNDNSISLKFEEVFDPSTGVQAMQKLIEWLDITLGKPITKDMFTEKINKSKQNNNETWDDRCTDIVNRICGRSLKEFGYEN